MADKMKIIMKLFSEQIMNNTMQRKMIQKVVAKFQICESQVLTNNHAHQLDYPKKE